MTVLKAKFTATGSCTSWRRRLSPAALLLLLGAAQAAGQAKPPAQWTLTPEAAKAAPGSVVGAKLSLTLDGDWHMYSLTTPPPGPTGGPTATTIQAPPEHPVVERIEVFFPAPERKFDPNFNLDTETYAKAVEFYLKIHLRQGAPAGVQPIEVRTRYQLCTDRECLPPKRVTVASKIEIAPGTTTPAPVVPAGYQSMQGTEVKPAAKAPQGQAPQGLGAFLMVAFGFGLASIFTPCVFPMIPITMSYFMSQESGSRGQALAQALVFCLGIVVLFTAIGFGLSAALGPFAVVQLGSNPYVNAGICVIFFVFALSLLGAFEITLPSGLLTRLNAASGRGGYIGTLLMGLTFCLASFACVGPFMGTLLAASVGGDKLQPVLGMLAFSTALASPFFLLALFPSMLKKLPRSGGWMSRVKVVLGFLVLATMLKYLSTVDQVMHWNLLTRERFLALWVVMFALPGLYLLGFLRLEGIKKDEELGTGRLMLAIVFLGFAIGLIPGMFGARLGEIEAFVPAPTEGAAALMGGGTAKSAKWIKNDFAGALKQAKAENKRVFVAFTGYACTNCKWMKANLFTRPEVAAALDNFILVELYTDGTDAESEANQKRQESLFQTVAIPYYAIFDAEEKVVATLGGLTKDEKEFLGFLQSGS
jgi:thiol:disulfide interchange protein DsbD